MIRINLAQEQESMKTLLAEHGYTFVKKEGIRLYFETPDNDDEKAQTEAKQIIKASPHGSILYFNIEVIK
ncbi:MAG: hypothetical protein LBI13_08310 [Streptococcaceae bacterium]|nr:hypothetical protein [Streptococcaceae bacterium]